MWQVLDWLLGLCATPKREKEEKTYYCCFNWLQIFFRHFFLAEMINIGFRRCLSSSKRPWVSLARLSSGITPNSTTLAESNSEVTEVNSPAQVQNTSASSNEFPPPWEDPWLYALGDPREKKPAEYTNFETSTKEFEWVRRLYPVRLIPTPPAHKSYPTPSGWIPPKCRYICIYFLFMITLFRLSLKLPRQICLILFVVTVFTSSLLHWSNAETIWTRKR